MMHSNYERPYDPNRLVLRCDQCGRLITLQHTHGFCSWECKEESEHAEEAEE